MSIAINSYMQATLFSSELLSRSYSTFSVTFDQIETLPGQYFPVFFQPCVPTSSCVLGAHACRRIVREWSLSPKSPRSLCHSTRFQYHVDTESWTSLPSPVQKHYQLHQLHSSNHSLPALAGPSTLMTLPSLTGTS